jgi:hypothetical protein
VRWTFLELPQLTQTTSRSGRRPGSLTEHECAAGRLAGGALVYCSVVIAAHFVFPALVFPAFDIPQGAQRRQRRFSRSTALQ